MSIHPARIAAIVVLAAAAGLATGCREPNQPPLASTPPAPSPAAPAPEQPALTPPTSVTTSCNIEFLGTQAFADQPLRLEASEVLRGWLGDPSGAALREPMLRLADEGMTILASMPIELGKDRPDVASAFPGQPWLQSSGFELRLVPDDLPAGVHRIFLTYGVAPGEGADVRSCDNGRRIVVSREP